MDPRYLTIEGFTARYGIGRTRIYYLIAGGDLHAIKCGRRTLIDAPAAEAWLATLPPANIHCHRAHKVAVS